MNCPCPLGPLHHSEPLLSPKSDRYAWSGRPGRTSTRMFAGLTSRCTSPAACAVSRAAATDDTIAAARPGESPPVRRTRHRASPPGTYRIAMNSAPLAWPASNTGMMCGSSTAAAARASRRKRRRNTSSVARAGARIFSATHRSSPSSHARNTTAIPPAPTRFSSRYWATREPTAKLGSKPSASSRNPPATAPPRCNPPATHLPPDLKINCDIWVYRLAGRRSGVRGRVLLF